MTRTFATTTFAVALFGLSACKGGAGDAIKLIPEGANVIGGADLNALMNSSAYKDNVDKIETAETKEFLDAASACNVGKDKWKNVTFGMNTESPDKKVAMVVNVDGLGKKENLECISGKIKEKAPDGEAPFTIEEADGKLTLKSDDGTGYVVNDNMVVFAGADWASAVKELVDGKGKAAVDGNLKDLVGRANTKAHVWAAGEIPADMASGPAEGAKDATVAIDVSDGLGIDASVGFGDAEAAKAKADELNKMYDSQKGAAGAMGVPSTVTDSVKIEAKDTAVHVAAKATAEDLKKISDSVGKMMGGGM